MGLRRRTKNSKDSVVFACTHQSCLRSVRPIKYPLIALRETELSLAGPSVSHQFFVEILTKKLMSRF